MILTGGFLVLASPAFIRLKFGGEIPEVLSIPMTIIVIPVFVLVFLTMIFAKEELKKWSGGG